MDFFFCGGTLSSLTASLVPQLVENSPAMQETPVRSLVVKIPQRREQLLIAVFWPGEYCIVHGVAKNWTQLSDFHFSFPLSSLKFHYFLKSVDLYLLWNQRSFQPYFFEYPFSPTVFILFFDSSDTNLAFLTFSTDSWISIHFFSIYFLTVVQIWQVLFVCPWVYWFYSLSFPFNIEPIQVILKFFIIDFFSFVIST